MSNSILKCTLLLNFEIAFSSIINFKLPIQIFNLKIIVENLDIIFNFANFSNEFLANKIILRKYSKSPTRKYSVSHVVNK